MPVDVIPVRDALELSIADGHGWRRHEGESYGFQESVCRGRRHITSHRFANQERKKLVLYSYIVVYIPAVSSGSATLLASWVLELFMSIISPSSGRLAVGTWVTTVTSELCRYIVESCLQL